MCVVYVWCVDMPNGPHERKLGPERKAAVEDQGPWGWRLTGGDLRPVDGNLD